MGDRDILFWSIQIFLYFLSIFLEILKIFKDSWH